MSPAKPLTESENAARVTALAALAVGWRVEFNGDRARRVTAVGDLARGWLEGTANEVRADLAARVRAHEQVGSVPSLFEIMGRSWHEKPYNRVIAWICEPNPDRAEHGVGGAVIRGLGHLLGLPELVVDATHRAEEIEVRGEQAWPELAHAEGIPDLLILAPSVSILIENKVTAEQSGEDQYQKYLDGLIRLATHRGTPRRAILLAPSRKPVPNFDGSDWAGESWDASLTHDEFAGVLLAVAGEPATSVWGGIVCRLVAEELRRFNHRERDGSALARSRDLLKQTPEPALFTRLAEMRHLLAELRPPKSPFKEM